MPSICTYPGKAYIVYNGYMGSVEGVASNDENKDVNFFDLFDPRQPRSPEELSAYRLKICGECPFFKQRTQQCSKCGCFMKLKTTLEKAKCPIGNW